MATSVMPVTNVLGQLIRERRIALEISGAELAGRLKVSRQFVHEVESKGGLRSFGGRALNRWARALRIGVEELKKARLADALARVNLDGAGGRLRRRRLVLGLSQKRLARIARCSPTAISFAERGVRGGCPDTAKKVLRVLRTIHPR